MILHNGSLEGRDWSTEILKRWTPDNRYTDVPALSTTSNNWNSASTRFLQNNSYMRLKNLTLSYNLPKQWISKLSLSSVQVYVQGDNLFTIHRNQGLDPEQGITGITYYRYPAMRTISRRYQTFLSKFRLNYEKIKLNPFLPQLPDFSWQRVVAAVFGYGPNGCGKFRKSTCARKCSGTCEWCLV